MKRFMLLIIVSLLLMVSSVFAIDSADSQVHYVNPGEYTDIKEWQDFQAEHPNVINVVSAVDSELNADEYLALLSLEQQQLFGSDELDEQGGIIAFWNQSDSPIQTENGPMVYPMELLILSNHVRFIQDWKFAISGDLAEEEAEWLINGAVFDHNGSILSWYQTFEYDQYRDAMVTTYFAGMEALMIQQYPAVNRIKLGVTFWEAPDGATSQAHLITDDIMSYPDPEMWWPTSTINGSNITIIPPPELNFYSPPQAMGTNVIAESDGYGVNLRMHAIGASFEVNSLRVVEVLEEDNLPTSAIEWVTLTYRDDYGNELQQVAPWLIENDRGYAQFTPYASVPVDEDRLFEAVPQLREMSNYNTGETYQLSFSATEGFDATVLGANIGISQASNGTNIEGDRMVVRKCIPTFTQENVSQNLVNGINTLYRWTVNSSEGSIVDLARLGYGVQLTDFGGEPLSLSQFMIYRNNMPLIPADEGPNSFRVYKVGDMYNDMIDLTEPNNALTYDNEGFNSHALAIVFYGEQLIEPASPVEYSLRVLVSGAGSSVDGDDNVYGGFLGEIYPYSLTGEVILWPQYSEEWGPQLREANGATWALSHLWSDFSGTYGDGNHTHGPGSLDWASGWRLNGCFGSEYWNTLVFSGEVITQAKPAPVSNTVKLYPNPFNPSTTISFELPGDAFVQAIVVDILGRQVLSLANGPYRAGQHHLSVDGSALSSGVYFFRLQVGDHASTYRLTLVK